MADDDMSHRIRDGLPLCISCETDTGFDKLKKKLGINRDRLKTLIEVAKKHIKSVRDAGLSNRLKSRERNQKLLSTLYSDKVFRYASWEVTFSRLKSRQNFSQDVPSLEYRLLSKYVEAYDFSSTDTTRCAEVFAEWPDLVQKLSDGIPWADFAAVAWDDIRNDLEGNRWASLNSDERNDVALAAFSVAVIVDDDRILHAAIKGVPDLATEFSDLLKNASPEDAPPEESVVDQWIGLCESLRPLVDKASSSPPDVDVLANIKDVVSKLSAIEQPVRESCSSILLNQVMERVNGFLGELKRDLDFSWLSDGECKRVTDCWHTLKSLSADRIKEEIDRIDDVVPRTIERIRRLAVGLSEAKSQRDSMSVSARGDLAELHALEEAIDDLDRTILTSRSEQRNARIQLLSDLSPFGASFNIDPAPAASVEPGADADTDDPDTDDPDTDDPDTDDPDTDDSDTDDSDTDDSDTDDSDTDDADTDDSDTEDADTDDSDTEDADTDDSDTEDADTDDSDTEDPDTEDPAAEPPAPAPSARQIADALRESPPRLAYAAQVSALSGRLGISTDAPLALLLKAAAIADYLTSPDGPIAYELSRLFEGFSLSDCVEGREDLIRDQYNMLALAASLRPTLLLPGSAALSILSSLSHSERLKEFFRFANAVVKSRAELRGVRVDSTMLRAARSDAAWRQERDGLRADLADWHQRAPRMTLIYAPATAVWKQWLSPEGIIGKLVTSIASNTEDASIKESLSTLHTRRAFNKHVKVTDRNLIGRQQGPDIEARALTQLYEHAQSAVDLARRHLSLRASQPANPARATIVTLTRLLYRVQRLGAPAAEELRTISNSGGPTLFVAAARTAAYAIDRFLTFIQEASDQEPDPQDILASALFPYPTIPISANGLPACDEQSALDALINAKPLDLDVAATKRLESGDFGTTRQMLRWIESNDLDHSDNIRRVLAQELQRRRRDLRHEIDDTRVMITTALSREHIQDAERTTYEAQLVEMERRIEHTENTDYESEYAVLRKIVGNIDTALDRLRTKAHAHLRRSQIERDSSRYAVIVDAIRSGDIITANEVIGRPEAIRLSSDTPPSQSFVDFYPSRSEALRKEIEGRPAPQVIREVKNSDVFGGMELTSVPRERRESAGRMLTAWYALRRAGRLPNSAEGHIETLLSEIGFVVRRVRLTSRSHRDLAEAFVETEPLDRRERCPIPEFGSSVSGRYRIVFLWRSPTEEDILQHANSGDRRQGTIVLYFAALDASRRAVLARLTRERSRTVVVVDDVLLLYLCGAVGSRVPILFACSLPLTYVQPYVTSAGLVPPEMFYGRESEIEEIAAPNGSCFIYGGRQLGKTALLRAVEKRYHRPVDDIYAVWIDLKREGVGYDRVYEHGVAGVWSTIWRALKNAVEVPIDVMDPNPNTPNIRRRIEDFVRFLEGYFKQESGRRLLLLLDEADKFLEVDAQQVQGRLGTEYRESARLKGLMDATERSIKVVFAGLHNVLRTAESSNHPLGHFGTPIQIRPLWRDARALILEPLTAAGYRLDDNLVVRVLARTNYYPHLIQLYGSDLVKSMANRVVDAPPFPIPEALVDDTYLKDTNLRQEFRQRFRLTLQLDPRYEVIAYTVAYECNEQHSALSDGLDCRQIDEKARGFWPEGFEDFEPGTDRFRSLLDEMDGLGVLRKVDDHRYTLRNPNVLMLMGSSEEIWETLLRDRKLPQEIDPATFRAHDPSGGDSPSRNPLTYQQEGSLRAMKNGVSVVCGLTAAGYDDVLRFLSRSGFVVPLERSLTRREFGEELVSHYDRRSEGTTIYVVPSTVPWDKEWVEESLQRVRHLNLRGRRDKNVRVLFMAGAARLLQIYSAHGGLDELGFQEGLEWVPLRPWREGFLLQWMNDVGIPDATEKCPKIIQHTGGWWTLLQRFYDLVRDARDFEVGLERLDGWFIDSRNRSFFEKQFGIDCIGTRREVLRDLVELKTADFADLQTFAADRGVDADQLMGILRWAELLHIVRRVGTTWKVDSVVGRLLSDTA